MNEPAEPVADEGPPAEQTDTQPDTLAEAALSEEQPSESTEERTTHTVKPMSQREDGDTIDTSPPVDDESTTWEEETETPTPADDRRDDFGGQSTDSGTETDSPVDDGPKRVPSPEEIAFGSDTEEVTEEDAEESVRDAGIIAAAAIYIARREAQVARSDAAAGAAREESMR
jgi:hypothetical protein